MGFLFTSESVSEGHPDKVSDQISDAILDEFLRRDANSKVACETLCTTGLVVVAGEVRSDAYVDVQGVARRVINRIGYTKSEYQFDCNSCGILSAIHEQSSDINQGVVREAEEEHGKGFVASKLWNADALSHGYGWQYNVQLRSIDESRALFVNVNDRILKLLRSRVKSATGETRAHYQGMIYVLERSLFPSQKN